MAERTILIVDDEVELAENVADLLEFEGYRVEMCASAEEAVGRVEARVPDLVLSDVRLPGMDGLELLRRLKEARSTLPVVMVSASSQKETREKIEKYGADGFILKPYEQNDLLKLIGEILKRGAE